MRGAHRSPATAGVEAKANEPPTAAFRAKPSTGTAPLSVTFTDQSKDSDGQAAAVRWNLRRRGDQYRAKPDASLHRAGASSS